MAPEPVAARGAHALPEAALADEAALKAAHASKKLKVSPSGLDAAIARRVASVLKAHGAKRLGTATDAVDAFARNAIAAGNTGEHFYVFDLAAVLERWRVWTTSLPRVQPFYAVKCNPDRAMLALLAALGTGFDCASPAEIEMVRSLGVDTDRIIYAHCCKMTRDIQHAANVGVQLTTYDTEAELDKIAQNFPDVGLVLRIRADDKAARCNLGDKYGSEEEEWEPLLRAAKARGLKVVGISFHVGSGARNPAAFPIAVSKAREAFDLAIGMGFDMKVLDLGGGYSGNLTEGITMAKVAASLNAALDEHFPISSGVRIIAEPGRYFAEPGMTLMTRVYGKRARERANADSRYYWVADGVYGSMNCLIYDHAVLSVRHFPLSAEEAEAKAAAPLLPTTLYGPTCDGMDTLLRGCPLPDLAVGDWLQWPSMGAYTLAAGSAFNGFDSQAVEVMYVFTGEL